MKRYLTFACAKYYPMGGMRDCIGAFDSIEDAKIALLKDEYGGLKEVLSHGHILDLETGKLVFGYDSEVSPETEVNDQKLIIWMEVDF